MLQCPHVREKRSKVLSGLVTVLCFVSLLSEEREETKGLPQRTFILKNKMQGTANENAAGILALVVLLFTVLHRADESIFDSRFGLYHAAVMISFLRSQIGLAVI